MCAGPGAKRAYPLLSGVRYSWCLVEDFPDVEDVAQRILRLLDVETLLFKKQAHAPQKLETSILRLDEFHVAVELVAQVLRAKAGEEQRGAGVGQQVAIALPAEDLNTPETP